LSLDICAIKDPMAFHGPCIFTGKTAFYFGKNEFFDDPKGHTFFAKSTAFHLRQNDLGFLKALAQRYFHFRVYLFLPLQRLLKTKI